MPRGTRKITDAEFNTELHPVVASSRAVTNLNILSLTDEQRESAAIIARSAVTIMQDFLKRLESTPTSCKYCRTPVVRGSLGWMHVELGTHACVVDGVLSGTQAEPAR
jgi:hypothetical protein